RIAATGGECNRQQQYQHQGEQLFHQRYLRYSYAVKLGYLHLNDSISVRFCLVVKRPKKKNTYLHYAGLLWQNEGKCGVWGDWKNDAASPAAGEGRIIPQSAKADSPL
ncbi:MAG: hypothetical protein IKC76_00760, partial [Firmicutes bacterium]|nr:hypothetical protein [Bacillota bacterium]